MSKEGERRQCTGCGKHIRVTKTGRLWGHTGHDGKRCIDDRPGVSLFERLDLWPDDWPPAIREAFRLVDRGQLFVDRQQSEGAKIWMLSAREVLGKGAAEIFPFVCECAFCDAEAPSTYTQAVKEGWTDISFCDAGSYSFLGTCPDCDGYDRD